MALELIDKRDNFEIIRDQIAAIILTESIAQQALALAAGKPDPSLWKLRVFVERHLPWEQFRDPNPVDKSPLVAVWFDNTSFNRSKSDAVARQHSETVFNIDCIGYGGASDNVAGGFNPSDREAAFATQRAIRLVRNILMAAENQDLQLPQGSIGERWPQSITSFSPEIDNQAVQGIWGARLALFVTFNEFSPQVAGETLEEVGITVNRLSNGELYFEADFT